MRFLRAPWDKLSQGLWLLPGLLVVLSGVLAYQWHALERQNSQSLLNVEAKLAATLLTERLQAVEAQTGLLATELGTLLQVRSKPEAPLVDEVFYDFAENHLPRSIGAEFFFFAKTPLKDQPTDHGFTLTERAGARNQAIAMGQDIGQATWAQAAVRRAMTSATGVAIPLPPSENSDSAGVNDLLVLAAVLGPEQNSRTNPFASRVLGYLGMRLRLTQVLPRLDEGREIQIQAFSPDKAMALAPLFSSAAVGAQGITWSAQPGAVLTQGVDWRVVVGRASSGGVLLMYSGALAIFLGGLALSGVLGFYLRNRQRTLQAAQAKSQQIGRQLEETSSLYALATRARGLGVIGLNENGQLVTADTESLGILGLGATTWDALGLHQWWLGLGERAAKEALTELADRTSQEGSLETLARLPNGSVREIGLSVVRVRLAGELAWMCLVENLQKKPWTNQKAAAAVASFEAADSELSLWSTDLRCLLGNPAFLRTPQRSGRSLINTHIDRVLAPEVVQLVPQALEGERQQVDIERPGAGTEKKTVIRYTLELLKLEGSLSQSVLKITGVNVSDAVLAQQDLVQKERVARELANTTPLPVFKLDQTGHVIQANTAAAQMLGYVGNACIGLDFRSICLNSGPAEEFSVWHRLEIEQTLNAKLAEFKRADGKTVEVRLFASTVGLDDASRAYWVIAQDRSGEVSTSQQEHELAKMAMRAVGSDMIAFAVFDERDELVFTNPAFRKLFRASAPVLHEKTSFTEFLRFGLGVGQFKLGAQSAEVWLAERLAFYRQDRSSEILALDDDNWVELAQQGSDSGLTLVYARDATEQYKAIRLAKQSSDAKSAFLASMSHEIRTPLNGILGMAQILAGPEISQEKRVDYAQTILDSGQVLLQLLNQVLDLAKIESGKVDLDLSPVSPRDICRSVAQLFASNAEIKKLSLSHDWIGPSARYLLDAQRLTQMLSNLVGNAVKFTTEGGVRIEGKELRRDNDIAELEFAVIDTGPGVSAAQQERLFLPFSQLDHQTSSNNGSTGLGLSIVKAMATRMGGEAAVSSTPGSGARFSFTLTASVDTEVDESPAARRKTSPDLASVAQGLRVMVLEDNQVMRQLLAKMLESLGAEAVMFEDGQAGLDAIAAGESANVLLIDLDMPVIGGLAVAEMIRQQEARTKGTPRLMAAVTASAFAADIEACMKAGMDEVLVKPVSVAQLSKFLSRAPSAKLVPISADKVDLLELRRVWRRLESQLEAQQYYAVETFEHFHDLLVNAGAQRHLQLARESLNHYDFEKVLDYLREIMAALNETPSGALAQ